MKTTLRKNERYMTTLTTKHHLGGYEIVRILCRYQASGFGFRGPDLYEDGPGGKLTKKALEEGVRYVVRSCGMEAYASDDSFDRDYTPREAKTIALWACGEVRRLYPELVDSKLESFEKEYAELDDEEGLD